MVLKELGWNYKPFQIPKNILEICRDIGKKGEKIEYKWNKIYRKKKGKINKFFKNDFIKCILIEKKIALDIDGDGIPDINLNTKLFTYLIAFVGFVIATVIHGFYDYFLLTSFMPGIWIMAFISLSIAVLCAQKAMTIHQDASPFKQPES